MITRAYDRRTVVRLAGVLLLGSACSDSGTGPDPDPTAAHIELSASTVMLHSIGETARVTATVTAADGRVLGIPVTWTTDDAGVATVSGNGTITAVANGSTTITAAAGQLGRPVAVTVSQQPAQVQLSTSTLTFAAIGDSAALAAVARDAGGTAIPGAAVTWSSSDPAVAIVSATGTVRAVGNGTASIAAAAGAAGDTATVTVAQQPDQLTLSPSTFTMTSLGDTLALAVTVTDGAGVPIPDPTVTWTSSDPSVATVTSAGRVIAAGNGTVRIIARAGTRSDTASITVSQQLARIVLGAPTTLLTALGDAVQLTAAGFDARDNPIAGILATLAFASSDTAVATLAGGPGVVNARANGTTTITASRASVSATLGLTVQQQVTSVTIIDAPQLMGIGAERDLFLSVADRNGHQVVGAVKTWSTSDAGVVAVDAAGRIASVGAGTATIIGAAGALADSADIAVTSRVVHHTVDPYLAAPIAGAVWEVPVAIVSYIPTVNGVDVDVTRSPDYATLGPMTVDSLERHLLQIFRRKKMALEQGSRFRAYGSPGAQPSIGIRVVAHISVYDLLPASTKKVGSAFLPDYTIVFRDLGLEQIIRNERVSQVWLANSSFNPSYPSYDPAIHDLADARHVWESNMSSPTTGDVSNSNGDPSDLPIYGHTYVVYGINFRRTQGEAVHNAGHQLEPMLAYANTLTDGNSHLFWRKFVGQDSLGNHITGRAGWTHMPPNTTQEYDYENPVPVQSDIEDWRPDGTGAKKAIAVDAWASLVFPWPGAQDFPQRVETQWYIYWFQSMPGLNNGIPLHDGTMTNWWYFLADWDRAIRDGTGLATVPDSPP